MPEERLILIDGNSLVNRAFYAVTPMTTSKGQPTNAVFGFVNMLIKMLGDLKPRYLGVCFDLPKPTFRHLKYDGYKATRKGMPDELASQMPLLKQLLRAMGITVLEKEGYEADDLLGTLAKRFKEQTIVLTGDRDCLQLIDDSTSVYLTRRGLSEIGIMDATALMDDMGLTPPQIIDYKALAGDSSDNIPGVYGIGDKTAVSLIKQYGDLDGIYTNIDQISGKLQEKLIGGKDMAYLSRELATIDINAQIDCAIEKMTYRFPFGEEARAVLEQLEFKSLLKREELFASDAPPVAAPPKITVSMLTSAEQIAQVVRGASVVALAFEEQIHIAVDSTTEYIVALNMDLFGGGVDYQSALKTLAPLLSDDGVLKVVFDYKSIATRFLGLIKGFRRRFDIQLAQYMVDFAAPHSTIIKWCAQRNYDAGIYAVCMLSAHDELREALACEGMTELFDDVETPLQDVLLDMERTGFMVDGNALDALGAQYSTELATLQSRIHELAGEQFNINSPRQLGNILFGKLGLPSGKKGRKGDYSTSADILESIDDNEIVQHILKYRTIAKLNSTYVDGLKRQLRGGSLIHTEFKQTVTATGRLSSVEPNLQNIPVREEEGRVLRKVFRAREGNKLVVADYSQIELRLAAHFSGDPALIEAYSIGGDIHTRTAAQVFGVAVSEVTQDMRRAAKAVNFGIIYGISEFGLAKQLGVSPREARRYIDRYFATYPAVKHYMEQSVARAKQSGKAVSMFGRVRYIPELKSANHAIRMFGERAAMNMPLQSTSADIIKIAMLSVHKRLQGMQSKLILQVHDELIVDAPVQEADEVAAILAEEMSRAAVLNVPLIAEVHIGDTWFDAK